MKYAMKWPEILMKITMRVQGIIYEKVDEMAWKINENYNESTEDWLWKSAMKWPGLSMKAQEIIYDKAQWKGLKY